MEIENNKTKKRRPIKKILLWIVGVFFAVVLIIGGYLYINFNQLLADALIKGFNSNIVSDVYELKFEKLRVNLLLGNIQVYNVELQPREKPLHHYPYLTGTLRLKTQKILLTDVELLTLLRSNTLRLKRIEITEPDLQIKMTGHRYILFPFSDTTGSGEQTKKKSIESFYLKEFELDNASFHVTNLAKQREFIIQQLNISLSDLVLDQPPGENLISYKKVELSIGEITGHMQKEAIQFINLKDYKITIDSLNFRIRPDTSIFHFADFSTGLKMLDIQTADSISHLTMQSFHLSYKDKLIKLGNIVFKPNISEAAMQKRFIYQTPQFSGSVGALNLTGLNFDSLIYKGKIFIDEVALDKVSVAIFKDQRKPIDKNRFPEYLGQQIKAIPIPLLIKQLKATNVNLVNREQKPDGDYGKININRATLDVKNITTLPSDEMLAVHANAYIENRAHANLSLHFDYNKPQFSMNGRVESFNLPNLNAFLKSYTPASIKKGVADEITFSGNGYRTNSTGTMKFLFHDLEVDLALHETAKWKSSVLTFAANTYLNESNPASAELPPRIVQFHAVRDMNKGFINMLIKSILNGMKETMIMSKENKKAYREAKKKSKKKNKD